MPRILVCAVLCSLLFLRHTYGDDWILAAEMFAVDRDAGAAEKAAAGLLPGIMLDYFSAGIDRALLSDEITDRNLTGLATKRQSLFLQLSAAVKTRDATLFETKAAAKKKALKTSETAITAVKNDINANIAETEKILAGLQNQSSREVERVVLWKNDNAALFSVPARGTVETAAAAERINGLISGQITVLDEYVMVSAYLRTFPGGKASKPVSDIGRLADCADIARRLAFLLLPDMVKTLPAHITFDIQPESVRSRLHVFADDMVFTSVPESITLQGGIHTMSFEAPGFRTESFTMNFDGDRTYTIHVRLNSEVTDTLSVSLRRSVAGSFLINAMPFPADTGNTVIVEVKNSPIFGRFDHADGNTSYFYVPIGSSQIQPQNTFASVTVDPKSRDVSARIENSRKVMYASYAAAITSLPVLFFALGEYVQYNNGYVLALTRGETDPGVLRDLKSKTNTWNTVNNVCIGITSALTVNFVVQLVLYLVQANNVIPEEAQVR
jgi:hypothetical protein